MTDGVGLCILRGVEADPPSRSRTGHPNMAGLSEGMVTRTVQLPEAELERFRAAHPAYGSLSWFLREALARYNALRLPDPDADTLITEAVAEITLDE